MARAITAGELTKLRSANQFGKLYLAIPYAATVVKVSLTALPTDSGGSVYELDISVVSGTIGNVIVDQTVMITNAGETTIKGYMRIRKAPTTSVMYVGEISEGEIDWAIGDRLHVLNDFQIAPRHIWVLNETTYYMDWDVVYSDQHENTDPVVVMGTDLVKWKPGSTVNITPDASGSYSVDGASITDYLWVAPGASATADLDTATPTITYNAAGTYRIGCTVTTSNAATFTGYRFVHVFTTASMPKTQFVLNSLSGSYQAGGWTANITLYDEAELTEIRDRAKVILFAQDYYSNVEESLGPVAGAENVIFTGWIVGQSIQWDEQGGSVTFDVKGPSYWMNLVQGFPSGLLDTAFAGIGGGQPARWVEMYGLTLKKALWHFLHWRSTVTRMMDVVQLPSSTKQAANINATGSTLWGQLSDMAQNTLLAHPCCDRYGRLFIDIDQNHVPIAARSTIPVVMDVTTNDFTVTTLVKRVANEFSQVELSGVYYSGGNYAPVGSYAPGRVPTWLGGGSVTYPECMMSTQAESDAWAGLVAGAGAGEVESAESRLAMNNRFIDVCPHQYLTTSLASTDTPRGWALTTAKLIPRNVTIDFDSENGAFMVDVESAGEGVQLGALEMTFPGEDEEPPGGDNGGDYEPPPPPPPPNTVPPPDPLGDELAAVVGTGSDVQTTADISVASPDWESEL